ncbi:MAG TPA: helix-turn-helix domain-containing protein [Cytophagaceae bacterium]
MPIKNQTSEQKDLRSKQAAEYLGLSLNYFYKLTSSKKIKGRKPGGKILYFTKEVLDQYKNQGIEEVAQ